MFRLILILFGGDVLIQRWQAILMLGLLALAVAAAVLGDLADGVADITTLALGLILLALALFELATAAIHTQVRRKLVLMRGSVMLVGASLVLDVPWDNAITSGAIFGVAFLLNGLFRWLTCWLVRFPAWRFSALLGTVYVVAAVLLLTSWPLPDDRNVSFCLSLALCAAGSALVRGALSLRKLPLGTRVANIPLYIYAHASAPQPVHDSAPLLPSPTSSALPPLTVHIWTAITATAERIRLPVFEHYVVALSRSGVAYSGHAALECGPNVYISHHPSERLRIHAGNALQQVRATPDNDCKGKWGSSYAEEAAAGRPSTMKLRLRHYDPQHLQVFWQTYRAQDTYNFTHRNCSSVVAHAVDAALEGTLSHLPFWPTLARLLCNRDLWHAARIRTRAETLAWTPGFTQDYVSALRRVTSPHSLRSARSARLARTLRAQNKARAASLHASTPSHADFSR